MNIVWSYWENRYSAAMPAYIGMCIETIRFHCGNECEFHLVSPDTIEDHLPSLPDGFDKLVPAHKADYLRASLTSRHGGAWIDADTVLLKGIHPTLIAALNDHEAISLDAAFTMSIFASRPAGRFVSCWEEAARDRIERPEPLYWSALGRDSYRDALDQNPPFHVRAPYRLYSWKDWSRFLQDEDISVEGHFSCALYNKEMFDIVGSLSASDILNSRTALGQVFRTAFSTMDI